MIYLYDQSIHLITPVNLLQFKIDFLQLGQQSIKPLRHEHQFLFLARCFWDNLFSLPVKEIYEMFLGDDHLLG
jgi:hypothetical protein